MPGPSPGSEMAMRGLSRALRNLRGEGSRTGVLNKVSDATGKPVGTVENWYDGTTPCEFGNLMLLVEAFGMTFLADVFADQDKDGALSARANAAADESALRYHLQKALNALDATPAKPSLVNDLPGDVGGREAGER